MRFTGILFLLTFLLSSASFAQEPVLFFSDLDWGPKSGGHWGDAQEGKGVAVTVWGKNLGSLRGVNFITVNGAQLINDSDYAEWGAIGPARDLERITFWLNDSCQDGAGEIRVTVNGRESNPLDFNITSGTIYFIDNQSGTNDNNGLHATVQGNGSGPWQSLYMFNPTRNSIGDGQYLVYLREGTYTERDADEAFITLKGPYGSPDKRKALLAYPGETPLIDNTTTGSANRGVVWNANYDPYGRNNYFTYSKLSVANGTIAIDSWGDYNRVVGCHFKDMLDDAWAGVVMVDNSQHAKVYGNHFEHCGYDSYKHNIYIKSHHYLIGGLLDSTCEHIDVGWNEFENAYAHDTHGGVVFLSTQSTAAEVGHLTNNIHLHHNYFHGGNMDFLYTTDGAIVHDVFVYNNIFEKGLNDFAGIMIQQRSLDFYFFNNVFYQMGTNDPMIFIAYDANSDPSNPIFANNIWYTAPGQDFFHLESGNQTFTSIADIFYSADGTASLPSGERISISDSLEDDPLFINPDNHDFRLALASPAIDQGSPGVGATVSNDFLGNLRPMGDGYDIGAYEYPGEYIPDDLAPAPPANLTIDLR